MGHGDINLLGEDQGQFENNATEYRIKYLRLMYFKCISLVFHMLDIEHNTRKHKNISA